MSTFDTALSVIPSWAAAGTGAGAGFFVIKWFFEWLGGRIDKREESTLASAERLDKATYKLIENLEKRLDALTDRLSRVEGELVECRAQHAQCETELNRLRGMVQGIGDAKQQAANIVAAERIADRNSDQIIGKIGEAK